MSDDNQKKIKRKKVKVLVEWPYTKKWIMDSLESIIERKKDLGLQSTLSNEIARIVENYLTGVALGRKIDSEVLSFILKVKVDDKSEDSLPDDLRNLGNNQN